MIETCRYCGQLHPQCSPCRESLEERVASLTSDNIRLRADNQLHRILGAMTRDMAMAVDGLASLQAAAAEHRCQPDDNELYWRIKELEDKVAFLTRETDLAAEVVTELRRQVDSLTRERDIALAWQDAAAEKIELLARERDAAIKRATEAEQKLATNPQFLAHVMEVCADEQQKRAERRGKLLERWLRDPTVSRGCKDPVLVRETEEELRQ